MRTFCPRKPFCPTWAFFYWFNEVGTYMLTEKEVRKLLEDAQHRLHETSRPDVWAHIQGQIAAYQRVLSKSRLIS